MKIIKTTGTIQFEASGDGVTVTKFRQAIKELASHFSPELGRVEIIFNNARTFASNNKRELMIY